MNEIQEASKIIQDMQVKVLTTSPMWMRLNYLCFLKMRIIISAV